MKDIKNSLKFFYSYLIILILFIVFVPLVLNIGKDNTAKFLMGYSLLAFLLLASMIFSDAKKIACIERKPSSQSMGYPLKGFTLGLMSFSPFILISIIYPLIRLDFEAAARIKHVILNTLLSPLYFLIKLGGESAAIYAVSLTIVPIIAGIGYFCGFKDYELKRLFNKKVSQSEKK